MTDETIPNRYKIPLLVAWIGYAVFWLFMIFLAGARSVDSVHTAQVIAVGGVMFLIPLGAWTLWMLCWKSVQ